jgi:hypothetical protein
MFGISDDLARRRQLRLIWAQQPINVRLFTGGESRDQSDDVSCITAMSAEISKNPRSHDLVLLENLRR